ncbi:hypothetical protein GUJ93_ZPchr0012g21343 [Zizania palustris]|uniref:Uncharacterized protein n=1 Tax=Zizania palustris TaxID=103762 RepID=A0A8J5WJY1_ZIZPA|nr:hypothetical protein GUJ93_ZPchr0012g21343 [Zizania palustris]
MWVLSVMLSFSSSSPSIFILRQQATTTATDACDGSALPQCICPAQPLCLAPGASTASAPPPTTPPCPMRLRRCPLATPPLAVLAPTAHDDASTLPWRFCPTGDVPPMVRLVTDALS